MPTVETAAVYFTPGVDIELDSAATAFVAGRRIWVIADAVGAFHGDGFDDEWAITHDAVTNSGLTFTERYRSPKTTGEVGQTIVWSADVDTASSETFTITADPQPSDLADYWIGMAVFEVSGGDGTLAQTAAIVHGASIQSGTPTLGAAPSELSVLFAVGNTDGNAIWPAAPTDFTTEASSGASSAPTYIGSSETNTAAAVPFSYSMDFGNFYYSSFLLLELAAATGSVVTGSGTAAITFVGSGSGSSSESGSGAAAITFTGSGTGTAISGGTGSAPISITATGSGQAVAGATGTATITFTASGSGAGRASGTGTAAITFAATGSGSTIQQGAGTAAVVFTASGSSSAAQSATGTASIVFTGSGAGTSIASGSGTAAITFTGSAAAGSLVTGSGVAALSFTGSGSGVSIASGSGVAPITFTASGDGTLPGAPPAGTASISFTATATGSRISRGAGTASITIVAAGVGQATSGSAGTASIVISAAGSGTVTALGAGLAAIVFAANAAGQAIAAGAGTASIVFTATGGVDVGGPLDYVDIKHVAVIAWDLSHSARFDQTLGNNARIARR